MKQEQVTVVLGADHGGFPFVQPLLQYLRQQGVEVISVGAESLEPGDDYPQFAFEVGSTVARLRSQGVVAYGALLCRSGAGMTIAANKVAGVRAVTATTTEQVRHARQHNDANVVSLSAEWLSESEIHELVGVFITTSFSSEERHQRRVAQITAYESA